MLNIQKVTCLLTKGLRACTGACSRGRGSLGEAGDAGVVDVDVGVARGLRSDTVDVEDDPHGLSPS